MRWQQPAWDRFLPARRSGLSEKGDRGYNRGRRPSRGEDVRSSPPRVIAARPEYYGLLLFALAGSGTLLETQLLAGSVDVTAYAVRTASGGLNLIVVNKDAVHNLSLTIQTAQKIGTATLQLMTGGSLAATSGVTIQSAAVNQDGSFAPASPEILIPSANLTTCYIPTLSAALISLT